MAQKWGGWYWHLCSAIWLAMGGALARVLVLSSIVFLGDCALAQITPDSTLGAESSVVTPTNIDGRSTERIDGGATRGANLFHSFERFSIPTGRAAYFNNAPDIQNIISRVTGGSISNIDGLIRANGTANLFLLNPNGIIFGPNASLNIGGSFLGSTASSLNFADGRQFSATNSQAPPLLTVNVPLGLQLGGTGGNILNQSQATNSSGEVIGLQVKPGKTLALLGGDVRLDSGRLLAPGGFVELGGVAGAGWVGLQVDGNNLRLSFPDDVERADVSLTNGADMNVRAGGGGSIALYARNLNMAGGSGLRAGIALGSGSIGSQGGDIEINATGAINLFDGSFISNSTFGQGDAGSVNIYADNNVSFDGSYAFSTVESRAIGNSGGINITTGSLSVTNGAQLQSLTRGQGNASSVTINARDTVSFDSASSNGYSSAAFSNVGTGGMGNGGGINITTGALSVTNGARLNASTSGQGNAGSVTINARDTVSFDGVGSNAFSRVEPRAYGNGGDINITAGSLEVKNGALLDAITFGRGDAGDINIIAHDTVSFYGIGSNGLENRQSIAETTVEPGAVGNGGDINITTGSLFLSDSAYLTTQTNSSGNSGNINIQAEQLTLSSDASLRGDVSGTGRGRGANITLDVTGRILLTGARSFINSGESTRITIGVLPGGIGSGGDLIIRAGSLVLTDGAIIKDSNQGEGNAGNIQINADIVDISGSVPNTGLPSGLFTSTNTTGRAGDIIVNTQTFRVAAGAALSARSKGDGQGGNITVNANTFEAVNGGQLVTTTFGQGQAGSIFVNATDRVSVSGSDPNYANRIAKFPSPIDSFVANDITETGSASGLFASTIRGSSANGGSINITAGSLALINGGELTVSSEGDGAAGKIEVEASSILLNNRAFLSSDTIAGQGNIFLRSENLVLRRGSNITTNATGTAEGGNITIDADVIVALENSDISANAQDARGGQVRINAQGIFGTEFRNQPTPESDITASSDLGPEFSGIVEINTPDVDPSSGLATLPTELVDASGLIAQGCPGGVEPAASKFVVTGRGGLPPTPRETIGSEQPLEDWGMLIQGEENRPSAAVAIQQTNPTTEHLVEAQGWVIDNKGEVVLTATAPFGLRRERSVERWLTAKPTVTPHIPWMTPAQCDAFKTSS